MVQSVELREPLKFKPLLQERIWGGDGLYRRLGKGSASDKSMGESWELSDRDDNATFVQSGSFAGQPFHQIFSKHARDILGQQFSPEVSHFPLLFKFISARDALSVQVHPGAGSPLGESKTECWYILEAPVNARLILGLAAGFSREQILQALPTSACRKVLNEVPVKSGDMLFIPAGTVHAITAGLLLYEVQQNSDTTFRIYDWDRLDAKGKPRAMHLSEAVQVLDFRAHNQHRINSLIIRHGTHVESYRVACRHFAVVHIGQAQARFPVNNNDRFRVLSCIRGAFELTWDVGQSLTIGLGETVLIPAACSNAQLRDIESKSELLVSFIPDLEAEIFSPLLKAGFSELEIRALGGLEGLLHQN